MLITENQRLWCKRVINHLYKWNLTLFFRKSIELVSDGLADYKTKVEKPMDLDTVKNTLYDGKYPSVSAFVSDLKLIWTNTKTYYGENTVFSIISNEVLKWICEAEKDMNTSEEEIWFREMLELELKLESHLSSQPGSFCISLVPQK